MKQYKDALTSRNRDVAAIQLSLKKFLKESKLMGDEISRLLEQNALLRSQLKTPESKMERLLRELDDTY